MRKLSLCGSNHCCGRCGYFHHLVGSPIYGVCTYKLKKTHVLNGRDCEEFEVTLTTTLEVLATIISQFPKDTRLEDFSQWFGINYDCEYYGKKLLEKNKTKEETK